AAHGGRDLAARNRHRAARLDRGDRLLAALHGARAVFLEIADGAGGNALGHEDPALDLRRQGVDGTTEIASCVSHWSRPFGPRYADDCAITRLMRNDFHL